MFWKTDEGRSQEPESLAPFVHWPCGLGLAGSTYEMGSKQTPPHRAARRTHENTLGSRHGSERCVWQGVWQAPLSRLTGLYLGLILSFWNRVLNPGHT